MIDRLIDLIISSIQLFQFFTVIDQYEQGVVLRLGKYHRTLGPGFHWTLPFNIEDVLVANVVPTTSRFWAQSLVTKDGKLVVVRAVVTHSIEDIYKFLVETEDAGGALADCTFGSVTNLVSTHTWDEIRTPAFAKKLTRAVSKQAKPWGLKIMSVQFGDISTSKSLRLFQD